MSDDGESLLGVVDIVQAFTALRHELKLQVRDGRELREATVDGLTRLEQAIGGLSRTLASRSPPAEGDAAARRLAQSIAEIEESLQRAVIALNQAVQAERSPLAPPVVAVIRHCHDSLRRPTRWLLGSWLLRTCDEVEKTFRCIDPPDSWQPAAEGISLLLARVHRLMAQGEIRRLDVDGLAFDPEHMNAIELVQWGRCPGGHVAEQLRPAYLWREAVLRPAEVRVEK